MGIKHPRGNFLARESESETILVWFRRDLRLSDNPALHQACKKGQSVLPVFIWAPEEEHPWEPGSASKWWLHYSLEELRRSIERQSGRLIIVKGPSLPCLEKLIQQTHATAVYWNRLYEPRISARDQQIIASLQSLGIECRTYPASLLCEPTEMSNSEGRPYQVFTPFWRRLSQSIEPQPLLPAPRHIPPPAMTPESLTLDDLDLLPRIDWAKGLRDTWKPGEDDAKRRLRAFCRNCLEGYEQGRNLPAISATSRLSPHLHFGEMSPRQVWQAVNHAVESRHSSASWAAAEPYLRQLGWREFGHHLLFHFPKASEHPLREAFRHFPWRRSPAQLLAWQKGLTGYPIVDAGMRELWHTGWMHNRVRMIVGSFLVKHLLLPWQHGSRWFWDTLVDADLANNTLGWQWVSGCGADAAPYFRVFNPVMQGEKFDSQGIYVRCWVPELAQLPNRYLHKPWQAPAEPQEDQSSPYAQPIVDHNLARSRALTAYEKIRTKQGG